MKFKNWKIADLIEYLQRMKHAPTDRLVYKCVPRVRGEIFIENGERIDGSPEENLF